MMMNGVGWLLCYTSCCQLTNCGCSRETDWSLLTFVGGRYVWMWLACVCRIIFLVSCSLSFDIVFAPSIKTAFLVFLKMTKCQQKNIKKGSEFWSSIRGSSVAPFFWLVILLDAQYWWIGERPAQWSSILIFIRARRPIAGAVQDHLIELTSILADLRCRTLEDMLSQVCCDCCLSEFPIVKTPLSNLWK
jgi:hypothetical protein